MKNPQGVIPLDGKLVSLRHNHRRLAPATQKTNAPRAATPSPVAYPAYGEEPIAAPKKR